jgi:predicted Mrr-cat superfamily restriction endonuclease
VLRRDGRSKVPEVYCVRAEYGLYARCFKDGGYVAIGWFPDFDLGTISDREGVQRIYPHHHPEDASAYVIGQQVGQVSRFLLDIAPGDFVVTPTANSDVLYWGVVRDQPYLFLRWPSDGCPYQHRRFVDWNAEPVQRSLFSVPLQNTMKAWLTVFQVGEKESFFEAIGRPQPPSPEAKAKESATELVLNRILKLGDQEFEVLVTELLKALGFEAQHVGRVGDGGVDATGEMDVYNVAKIKLYVQAKRYKRGSRISPATVRSLRQNIPTGAQGAFITTADFQPKAMEVATESGFPRIGTVNGEQLVDMLAEKWEALDPEIRSKLGLKRGLVLD